MLMATGNCYKIIKTDPNNTLFKGMTDLNNRDFEYTVQASSVDEAGNKYAEPQATTFYMPLEPITVAPTDHL